MKFPIRLLTVIFFVLLIFPMSLVAQTTKNSVVLEDFESDEIGLHPYKWFDRDTNFRLLDYNEKVKSTYKYKVLEEEGNKFLRYEGQKAMHINYPLLNKNEVDLSKTPILTWDWRIHDLPEGANEDTKYNDAAASVYVVFDFGKVFFRKVPKSIRYTWSSSLPAGTELSKFHGNQKIVVIGTGGDQLGEWLSVERNLKEDYRRLFKDNAPDKPLALLLLSDGDDTNSNAKADYDNFVLKSANNK